MGYVYLLKPKGAKQRVQITRKFLKMKELEFEKIKNEIIILRNEVACSERPLGYDKGSYEPSGAS